MTDLDPAVADLADWVHELAEEMGAPVCRDGVWTFPVSEGEERDG